MHWYEIDASRRGADYFDKHYGSGAEGYVKGSADYFDRASYNDPYNRKSPYINPRTGSTNQQSTYPTSGSIFNVFDILPITTTIFFIL